MLTAVQSFPPVPPVAAPDTSGDNSGLVDSCLPARSTQTLAVRQKFEDIFQVSKSCHIGVNSDLENYSDNVSVAARLSDPGVIEFFRSIGASDLILNKLQFGHHPDLTAEVPSLRRENNGSFRKHIDFATQPLIE
jgi:hypothetical protein